VTGAETPGGATPRFSLCVDFVSTNRREASLEGELDVAWEEGTRQLLDVLLTDGQEVQLTLDRLTFLDVPGVRLLVEMAGLASRRGCNLVVAGATKDVARLLDLTSARSLLPMAP
jgi:anti-anti-sigma factor